MATSKSNSDKKPAAKKTVAKKPTVKKAISPKVKVTAKTTTSKTSNSKKKTGSVTPAERYTMVQVAAYYLAQKNGFSGNSVEYWIKAEAEVNKKFAG